MLHRWLGTLQGPDVVYGAGLVSYLVALMLSIAGPFIVSNLSSLAHKFFHFFKFSWPISRIHKLFQILSNLHCKICYFSTKIDRRATHFSRFPSLQKGTNGQPLFTWTVTEGRRLNQQLNGIKRQPKRILMQWAQSEVKEVFSNLNYWSADFYLHDIVCTLVCQMKI